MTVFAVPKPPKRFPKERFFKPQKTKALACPLEEDEQAIVAEWLDSKNILFQASELGAYMHPATFIKLKKIGCKKSHPDITIYTRCPKLPEARGVAIELKRKKGIEARPDQLEYLERMKAEGWEVAVCKGAEVAISYLKELGY